MTQISHLSDARLEDIEFMIDHGETRERVASRLGIAVNTLAGILQQAGRHDLLARCPATEPRIRSTR